MKSLKLNRINETTKTVIWREKRQEKKSLFLGNKKYEPAMPAKL